MKRRLVAAAVLFAASSLSACRQSDGTLPSIAQAHKEGDIGDVGKDILNVVAKAPEGPKEFGEDLRKFSQTSEAEPLVKELARRIVDVLQSGSKIAPADANKLAEALWQGISARDISERQSKALQEQVKQLLVAAGAPESSGESVAAQLREVQKVANERPEKWYEVF